MSRFGVAFGRMFLHRGIQLFLREDHVVHDRNVPRFQGGIHHVPGNGRPFHLLPVLHLLQGRFVAVPFVGRECHEFAARRRRGGERTVTRFGDAVLPPGGEVYCVGFVLAGVDGVEVEHSVAGAQVIDRYVSGGGDGEPPSFQAGKVDSSDGHAVIGECDVVETLRQVVPCQAVQRYRLVEVGTQRTALAGVQFNGVVAVVVVTDEGQVAVIGQYRIEDAVAERSLLSVAVVPVLHDAETRIDFLFPYGALPVFRPYYGAVAEDGTRADRPRVAYGAFLS